MWEGLLYGVSTFTRELQAHQAKCSVPQLSDFTHDKHVLDKDVQQLPEHSETETYKKNTEKLEKTEEDLLDYSRGGKMSLYLSLTSLLKKPNWLS